MSYSKKPSTKTFPVKTMGLLIADIFGFSRLAEKQIPGFERHMLWKIASLIEMFPSICLVETRGDGLLLVFSSTVHDVGMFALELSDHIQSGNFRQPGFPDNLKFRIAVHIGPLSKFWNPIMGRWEYTGSHKIRTARLEPITPPGLVYATQEFAALTVAQGVREFTCDYVGQMAMPKGHGVFPIYHVRRLHNKSRAV